MKRGIDKDNTFNNNRATQIMNATHTGMFKENKLQEGLFYVNKQYGMIMTVKSILKGPLYKGKLYEDDTNIVVDYFDVKAGNAYYTNTSRLYKEVASLEWTEITEEQYNSTLKHLQALQEQIGNIYAIQYQLIFNLVDDELKNKYNKMKSMVEKIYTEFNNNNK